MRAREPDERGHVVRDGVRLGYESFGSGELTVLFVPTDTIVDSRVWKGQVPYLARHARVVTVDPPGNGRSDRPTDPRRYDETQWVADTLHVMDALGIERAVLVGICSTAWLALVTASLHPDRVLGVVAVAPNARDHTPPLPHRARAGDLFDEVLPTSEGWAKLNRHHWLADWPDFVSFFFDQLTPEPHSTKVWEDAVDYACGTTPEVMLAAHERRPIALTAEDGERLLRGVRCPVLVVSGTEDRCQPVGRFETVVRLTGADHVVIDGAGHLPMARHPVVVNRAVKAFLDRITDTVPSPERPTSPPVPPGSRRRPRVLYLSSPIGLGHVRRDLAIADALRELRPDLEVEWLTQSPVAEFLEARGERVHPASRLLANESAHLESECGEHDLHAFAAIRGMDEILVNNFMVFDDLVERESFDLWVGDEAWDLDHFLHETPALKRAPFVWMTDFVGWVPMPDGGPAEAALTADWNAEMVEHVARTPTLRDRSVFVGDAADVVDLPLGPGLPTARAWTEEHFDFAGYVMGERPDPARRDELRARLGYAPDDVVCVVSVGGSGVGSALLRRIVRAFPSARRQVPGLRMVVVTGPRIAPASLDAPDAVEVHGFLPDLDLHHAACDVAVVQGGLATTMELTAARRPFLYVPLRHHFEQQVHVRHRLERHRAGRALDFDDCADPDHLAAELVAALTAPVAYRPVPTDGARRAAQLVAEVL